MAIKVLELHHQGVRVGGTQEAADQAAAFYRDVMGLGADPGRPNIPGIPGYWVDVGGRAQILRFQRRIALKHQCRDAADIGGGERSARRDLVFLIRRRQEDIGAGRRDRDVVAPVRRHEQLFLRIGSAHRNHIRIGGGKERR